MSDLIQSAPVNSGEIDDRMLEEIIDAAYELRHAAIDKRGLDLLRLTLPPLLTELLGHRTAFGAVDPAQGSAAEHSLPENLPDNVTTFPRRDRPTP